MGNLNDDDANDGDGWTANDAHDDDDDDQGVICQGVHQSLPKWPDRINGFEGPSPY